MNRSLFASAQPLKIKPAIGQRWVLKFTDAQILERAIKFPEDRRDKMIEIWETQRSKGFVIIGENDDGWITHVKPVNPHPRMQSHSFKKEWLRNYKFKGFEEIA